MTGARPDAPGPDRPGMVIVGAGEAGARAALALRAHGWDGAITLIGEEPTSPYERPPLSKSVMTDEAEPQTAVILSREREQRERITFLHDRRAVAVDRAARTVRLADGESIAYDRLLIAVGARPRRLSVPGAEAALYLRTFADALALRAHLRGGVHLAVVGGGFIGLEIAASAVARGCHVTLLEAGPRILMRGVPAEIAERVAARHAAAGVVTHVGVGIARIEAKAGGAVIVLDDGTRIACDGVVAGVGAAPETGLAEQCGLDIENGVRADAMLRTSDEAIYTAGDCCSFPSATYDGYRLRLEAWKNAQAQGELAARNMLGEEVAYEAVPWFWSDQYDQVLQVSGLPGFGATTIRRDSGDGALLCFSLASDGRLVAASGVGKPAIAKDIRAAEMLIARRAYPDPAALAAPEIKLKSLLA